MPAGALDVLMPAAPGAGPMSYPLWQHQLGLLLESTGEGIFGVDLGGHCMFINRAGARMIGFEPPEVLGHNMHELTHHSHADGSAYPDTECPIFNAFRRGLPCRIESEVFWRHDRTPFPVEYWSYPILLRRSCRTPCRSRARAPVCTTCPATTSCATILSISS